jgi:hypothetical protein
MRNGRDDGMAGEVVFLVIPRGYFPQLLSFLTSHAHLNATSVGPDGYRRNGQRERDLCVFDPFGLISGEAKIS